MSKHRRAAKVDSNQSEVVSELLKIPGVTVEVGHDDILVGYRDSEGVRRTNWYEIKNPETVSPKTGKVRESEITDSERTRRDTWKGHYRIVWTVEQILEEIFS